MRLLPSDPDIETIVSRIKSGDVDLQPAFQRGEVWSKPKKQRLVDSILRDWHVPPVHVIENAASKKQEVLDGQQRLAAIRDFVDNQLQIDGEIEPQDLEIKSLDGMRFRDLPDKWKRQFNQFTIRIFRIVDYRATEPAELFFRLNQPASLTGAEQRNAFYGPVREQIKELVSKYSEELSKDILGFSNSRMAYDDVLSRTALAIQRRSIAEKITSIDLTDLYRSEHPLTPETMALLGRSIELLGSGVNHTYVSPKFNKATLFSWFMFLVRSVKYGDLITDPNDLANFLAYFQTIKNGAVTDIAKGERLLANAAPATRLFAIYDSRASSRVADVSSVILRDAIIWLTFAEASKDAHHSAIHTVGIPKLIEAFRTSDGMVDDDAIARRLLSDGWGRI